MHQHPNVMIVDDDGVLRRALQIRCETLGIYVRSHANMVEAVESAFADPPDLMILDVNTCTGNGLEACEVLADDSRTLDIPKIIITGDADATTRRRAMLAGAIYIRKGAHLWDRIEHSICSALSIPLPDRVRHEAA